MQSKGHKRKSIEQAFQDECREYFPDDYVLHHCVGAKGKHKKVHIGEWFINFLSIEEHAVIHRAGKNRKKIEKENYFKLIHIDPSIFEMVPSEIDYLIGDYHL